MNNEIEVLNIHQLELTDIYRTPYPTTAQYAFFSSADEIVSKTEFILGHNTNLNTFKKAEITHTQSICSDNNGMKLDVSNRRKTRNM